MAFDEASYLVAGSGILGLLFALFQFWKVSLIAVDQTETSETSRLREDNKDPYVTLLKCYDVCCSTAEMLSTLPSKLIIWPINSRGGAELCLSPVACRAVMSETS